jgi:hypothetical protein
VTLDEELIKLEDDIRRLKIEWEVYFNGSSERPPRDLVYRIETYIKRRTADQSDLSFGQRYKLSSLAQKYAVQNALWKRRLMDKEEGRGQFAQQKRGLEALTAAKTLRIVCSDPEAEPETVDQILQAIISAQRDVGRRVENVDPARFQRFLCDKTEQIKALLCCSSVEFCVGAKDGKLVFKAARA